MPPISRAMHWHSCSLLPTARQRRPHRRLQALQHHLMSRNPRDPRLLSEHVVLLFSHEVPTHQKTTSLS